MNSSRFIILLFLCAGCSQFKPGKELSDPSLFSAGDSSLNPASDKLAEKCFGSADYDACLYLKNPVAQEKVPVMPAQSDERRRFGVKIRGLAMTGFLENANVAVYALHSPRFILQSRADLKNPGKTEAAGQFSAYYWSNRMFDYLNARLGPDRVPLHGLKIYADDIFTGYSAANNSVHLSKRDGEIAKAFSGEVVINLAAQALANSLSAGKLFTKDSTKHNFCILDPKACCTTELGCAQALANGFGDYTAAMMFPDQARAGETIANSAEGQKICAISRDLTTLSAHTKTQVFSACEPKGRAALMGAWYASVWWKLRNQLEAKETGAGVDVDKMFFDHARAWVSTSSFADAKSAALAVAQIYKGGKFSAAVSAALTSAGI